jgi:hypothetical protein
MLLFLLPPIVGVGRALERQVQELAQSHSLVDGDRRVRPQADPSSLEAFYSSSSGFGGRDVQCHLDAFSSAPS